MAVLTSAKADALAALAEQFSIAMATFASTMNKAASQISVTMAELNKEKN